MIFHLNPVKKYKMSKCNQSSDAAAKMNSTIVEIAFPPQDAIWMLTQGCVGKPAGWGGGVGDCGVIFLHIPGLPLSHPLGTTKAPVCSNSAGSVDSLARAV